MTPLFFAEFGHFHSSYYNSTFTSLTPGVNRNSYTIIARGASRSLSCAAATIGDVDSCAIYGHASQIARFGTTTPDAYSQSCTETAKRFNANRRAARQTNDGHFIVQYDDRMTMVFVSYRA
jgi:hypothetical protein